MSRTRIAALLLLAVSIGTMIYQSETAYQHLDGGAKWARSFGYGLTPWIVGIIVATIKAVWAKIRNRPHNFSRSVLWATGIFTVIIILATAFGSAKSQDRQEVHDDASMLMGASVWAPGVAAYCHKYVEPNEELVFEAPAVRIDLALTSPGTTALRVGARSGLRMPS